MLLRIIFLTIICLHTIYGKAQFIQFKKLKPFLSDVYGQPVRYHYKDSTHLVLVQAITCHECLDKLYKDYVSSHKCIFVHITNLENFEDRQRMAAQFKSNYPSIVDHWFILVKDFKNCTNNAVIATPHIVQATATGQLEIAYDQLFVDGCK